MDAYFLFNQGNYEAVGLKNENFSLPSISKLDVEKFEKAGMKVIKVKCKGNYETYRVYDPNFEEYNEVTLPLRARVGDKEVFCKKNHTEQFPTKEMVQYAEMKYNEISKKIQVDDLLEKFHKQSIDGLSAYINLFGDEKEILESTGEYKAELVNFQSGAYFVLNISKIKYDSNVKVKVPERDMGLMIGKKGSNLKNYSTKYKFKFIQVVGDEEH